MLREFGFGALLFAVEEEDEGDEDGEENRADDGADESGERYGGSRLGSRKASAVERFGFQVAGDDRARASRVGNEDCTASVVKRSDR